MSNHGRARDYSRRLLGDARTLSFLQAIAQESTIIACGIMARQLQAGRSLDEIFSPAVKPTFQLTAGEIGTNRFWINFGCLAEPLAGDGGIWLVTYDQNDQVEQLTLSKIWNA